MEAAKRDVRVEDDNLEEASSDEEVDKFIGQMGFTVSDGTAKR